MPELTQEQAAAAQARGQAVLVSAAAGAGKTTVLTERVASLCLEGPEPVDLDRLLVVTFTEKAALEMRERIARRLEERAAAGVERAREQLLRLPQAQISTIHAFGHALLLDEWERAGHDPELRLLDERQAALCRLRALDLALARAYAEQPGMADLVAYFGGMGEDDGLRAALGEAARFLDALPDSPRRLREMVEAGQSRAQFRTALALLVEESGRVLRQAASLLRQAELAARDDGEASLEQALAAEAQALRDAATPRHEGWDEHRSRLAATDSFPALQGIGKSPRARALREDAKRTLRALIAWLEASPEELLWRREEETAPRLRLFAQILAQFQEAYRIEKERLRALDFSDLEQEAHRLLHLPDGAVRERLRNRYREMLVDEFQDVSPLQDAIVRAIAGEPGGADLFLVGDPKQSIYAFRHAAPWIFLARQGDLGARGASLPLRENFRCRPEIVAVVNHLFSDLMRENDSPRYDEAARLVAGRLPETQAPSQEDVRLVLIGGQPPDAQGEDDADGEPSAGDFVEEIDGAAAQEATWIAREIARLVKTGYPVFDRDLGVMRPVAYRDCAVLLRSLASVAGAFDDAFEAAGVPAEVQRSSGYFASLEVQTLLGLLRAIELPQRDRDLAIALRAPFFAVSARDLRDLRDAAGGGSLWDGLAQRAGRDDRCRAMRDTLARWRAASLAMPLAEFVPWLLDETRYRAYVAARPRSGRRLRDLEDFAWRATEFAAADGGGLGLFLQQFEELGRRSIDQAPPAAGIDDAVAVMSVHRSKGLEWPVVFVAGLQRDLAGRERTPSLRWHLRHGVGAAWVDLPRGVRRETAAMRAITAASRAERRQEEVRLLYVATTRARDRLYLTAVTARPDPVPGMDDDRFLGARSALDWIWPSLLAAQGLPLRVMREPAPLGEQRGPLAFDPTAFAPDGAALEYLRRLPAGPDEGLHLAPARLSATDLADSAEGSFAAALRRRRSVRALRPELDASEGRRRGTLTHLFLQHLDYAAGSQDLTAQLDGLIGRGLLPEEARGAVDLTAVARFLGSQVAGRVRAAARLERELAFSLLVDESGAPDPDGDTLLQGKIDLLACDDSGWLILDFKTDHVTAEEAQEAAKAYAGQVAVYRAAVRAITGREDVAAALVFLQPGIVVPA